MHTKQGPPRARPREDKLSYHTLTVKKKVVGVCEIFSSSGPIVCPLCSVTVPANTLHRCERKE